jgi:hypothetical protein
MTMSQTGQTPMPYVEQERAAERPRRYETQELTLVQKILVGVIVILAVILIYVIYSLVVWLG